MNFHAFEKHINLYCTTLAANFGSKGKARKTVEPDQGQKRDFFALEKQISKIAKTGPMVRVSYAPAHYGQMDKIFPDTKNKKSATLVCVDLIERLVDPRPLLASLRNILLQNPQNRLVIATPDREKNQGFGFVGKPSDTSHVRNWTLNEFSRLMQSSGFRVLEARHISSGPDTHAFVVADISHDYYSSFLSKSCLPLMDISHLLISAEHADFKYAGGIGSYAQEMERLLGKTRLGICFVGEKEPVPEKFPDRKFVHEKRWLVPRTFFTQEYIEKIPKPDLVLQMVDQALYFYPKMQIIESQDCDGFGVRVAQAGQAGLFPRQMRTKIRCHGTYVYLENAHKKWWTDKYHLKIIYDEKQAIEQADIVSFPTAFLCKFYLDAGYSILPERIENLRYPFSFPEFKAPMQYKPIDTLIFFGARTRMKGFHIFVAALKKMRSQGKLDSIKKIAVIGSKDPYLSDENFFIKSLKSDFEIFEAKLPRHKALKFLSSHSSQALCVLPYLGDNHPNAVLEAIFAKCQILAANAGGIPELVSEQFHKNVLCEPDSDSLFMGITNAITMDPNSRKKLVSGIYKAARASQEIINQAHVDGLDIFNPELPQTTPKKTMFLLNCRAKNPDLIPALRNQTMKPDFLLILESEPGLADVSGLKALDAPFEILTKTGPKDFAKAVNKILKHEQSDILINLDSGYVPNPDFVQSHVEYFSANSGVAAVTGYCEEIDNNKIKTIRPIGDGLLLALTQNCLGHGAMAFDVEQLKKQGWLKALAVDDDCHGLLMKIISSNKKIGVIPRPMSVRCARKISLDKFTSGQSLAQNIADLPRFEALRLAGVMSDYTQMQQTAAIIMARELEKYPALIKAGKWTLEKLARVYFGLKKQ